MKVQIFRLDTKKNTLFETISRAKAGCFAFLDERYGVDLQHASVLIEIKGKDLVVIVNRGTFTGLNSQFRVWKGTLIEFYREVSPSKWPSAEKAAISFVVRVTQNVQDYTSWREVLFHSQFSAANDVIGRTLYQNVMIKQKKVVVQTLEKDHQLKLF